MTTSSENNPQAGESSPQLLYAVYTAIARDFIIDLSACAPLDAGQEDSPEEVRSWFLGADELIPVHQLRQFFQTSSLVNRENLSAALRHYLHKAQKTDADRDKADFLLVQFFSSCASSQLQSADANLEFVARTLEPILGKVEPALAESLRPLEALIASADGCRSLQELFGNGILEQGRSLKASCGESYFDPSNLIAFTRFNFLMRRVFFCLMHQDLNAILEGLRQLELRGVATLDCRLAEFTADEPVARLRMICQSWKAMFQAEYSSGQPLRLLADLRGVIDARLQQESPDPENPDASQPGTAEPPLRAKAAAASGNSSSESDAGGIDHGAGSSGVE